MNIINFPQSDSKYCFKNVIIDLWKYQDFQIVPLLEFSNQQIVLAIILFVAFSLSILPQLWMFPVLPQVKKHRGS